MFFDIKLNKPVLYRRIPAAVKVYFDIWLIIHQSDGYANKSTKNSLLTSQSHKQRRFIDNYIT